MAALATQNDIDFINYKTANGHIPFEEWYNELPKDVKAIVLARLNRLRRGNFGDCKSAGTVSELRIDYGPGYRIYYARKGAKLVILLGGGTKRKQDADIKRAGIYWEDYKAREIYNMAKSRKYTEFLHEQLQDTELAAAYLNAALEDEDVHVFLMALRDVAEAKGGMTKLAKEAHLNRESLYKTLSKNGNPRLTSLKSVLGAYGLTLAIHSEGRSAKRSQIRK